MAAPHFPPSPSPVPSQTLAAATEIFTAVFPHEELLRRASRSNGRDPSCLAEACSYRVVEKDEEGTGLQELQRAADALPPQRRLAFVQRDGRHPPRRHLSPSVVVEGGQRRDRLALEPVQRRSTPSLGFRVVGLPVRVQVKPTPLGRRHPHL